MRDVVRTLSGRARARTAPVTVLAIAAAVLAAGGGAYAATSGSTQRQAAAGQRGSSSTHQSFASSKGAPFVAGAAVVNSNGSLARGAGVTSSSEVGLAEYQVLFNRKVNRCAYEATLGSPGTGVAPDGQIGVASRHAHKNGVWIVTYSSSGSFEPLPFHLVVIC